MKVVTFKEPHRPGATPASAAPAGEEPKPAARREPAKTDDGHEDHEVHEPGYGHGV